LSLILWKFIVRDRGNREDQSCSPEACRTALKGRIGSGAVSGSQLCNAVSGQSGVVMRTFSQLCYGIGSGIRREGRVRNAAGWCQFETFSGSCNHMNRDSDM
jgi:hypothetical protein